MKKPKIDMNWLLDCRVSHNAILNINETSIDTMTVANNDSNDNSKNNNLRISSGELKKKIDKGEDIFILDVRNQHDYDPRNVLLQS